MQQAITSPGSYVDLIKTEDHNLCIALTDEGQSEFAAIEAIRDQHGIDAGLQFLLDDHLVNNG